MRKQLSDNDTLGTLRRAFGSDRVGPDKIRAYHDTEYNLPYRIGGQYETLGAGKSLDEAISAALNLLTCRSDNR